MRAYVGVTDRAWYDLLSAKPGLAEVNFWQPGGNRVFGALAPGELFLFKLHSPDNFIVGGGVFAHSSLLPVRLAWDTFGESNGARSLSEMRRRIEKYRRAGGGNADYTIGCTLLEQPFFFPRERGIAAPADWKPNIVQGKTYDLAVGIGLHLWEAVQSALADAVRVEPEPVFQVADGPRTGKPALVTPRLGQGSFRVMVIDAYDRRCAVTRERTLPALEAAHIKPYAEGGEHAVSNGLLLRRDLHALFDQGYVTVTPEHVLEVSRRIREEFENGHDYYALHGTRIAEPGSTGMAPSREALAWHNENVFVA